MPKSASKDVRTIISAVKAAVPENRKSTVGELAGPIFTGAIADDLKAQSKEALVGCSDRRL